MAKASLERHTKSSEVFRLASAGLSQRQIAGRLGLTRSMVQRILENPVQISSAGSDAEVSQWRADMRELLDLADGDLSLLRGYAQVEDQFNAENGLTGMKRVQMAALALMMTEGALINSGH